MVSTRELDEIETLLAGLRKALAKKENAEKPMRAVVTHPVTGGDVEVELPPLSEEEVARIGEDYQKALEALKSKVASIS